MQGEKTKQINKWWRYHMKCALCQIENSEGSKFCAECGASLGDKCLRCSEPNSPDSKFCRHCGTPLNATGLMPPASAAQPLEGFRAAAERRHLTILFCDIGGSTSRADSLRLEALNEVNRGYLEACERAIHEVGGFLSNKFGDSVQALFGYPHAHEDDAERAVRAALSIIQSIGTSNSTKTTFLDVRVGIASGDVLISSNELETLVGETPNRAVHLQAAAQPNSILITDETRQLLSKTFLLQRLQLQLKGETAPSTVWRVIGETNLASRFATHVVNLTDFVGRDQEVALLTGRWQQAIEGEGQVVLLFGEAGIGKSRIVEMFRQDIANRTRTPTTLYQCSPFHLDSPLHPIISRIQREAEFAANDPPDVKLGKLEALLRSSTTSPESVVPLFAALLSIDTGGRYPPPDPDPQRRKERTLNALVQRLADQTTIGPTLMIFEDVHWADPTTLDLLGRMILRVHELSALLIVTCRPEFKAGWVGHPQITALILNRLGRRHCRAMIESIAGRTMPTDIVDQIVAKTDGVPLFVEELTKNVLESGSLREIGDALVLIDPQMRLAIPSTLRDSLTARLDRLETAKEVAQIGAAIGREFSYPLLAAVSTLPEIQLQDALLKLVAAELIFVRGAPPTATYVFKHALVQDAAYDTFVRSNRQQLHARIADVLETRFPETAETQPEILAHHFMLAGRLERSIHWGRKAGDLAIRRSANREAVGHLGRVLELLKSRQETRERDTDELDIRIKLSGPLIATGGYVSPELSHNYARASDLCIKLGEDKSAFPVMYGQWVIPYVRGDMKAAVEQSEKFLHRSKQQDDVGLRLMGHRIYGSSLVWRGDTKVGRMHLEQARDSYRPEHAQLAYSFGQHPRTAALAQLSLALQHLGDIDQAMAIGNEAIKEAKRFGHFNSIAYSLCFVSLLIMLRRDIGSLRETASELLQTAEHHNSSYWTLRAKPMLGWVEAHEGNVESGLRQMRENTEALREQRANLWVPQTLLLEAEFITGMEQYERAYALLDVAQALIEPLDQRFYEAELHRVRGVVLISEGSAVAGEASIDRAIEVARRQNSRFLELRASVVKARMLASRDREEARRVLTPIYQSFSEGFDTADLVEARALLGAPA
jgi:class 3 adenylate cyclase/predicted ATPase